MSLSPSPVEQVNDVVIIHLCWSLIGLKSPTCKWSNTEVKNADQVAWSILSYTEMCVVTATLKKVFNPCSIWGIFAHFVKTLRILFGYYNLFCGTSRCFRALGTRDYCIFFCICNDNLESIEGLYAVQIFPKSILRFHFLIIWMSEYHSGPSTWNASVKPLAQLN